MGEFRVSLSKIFVGGGVDRVHIKNRGDFHEEENKKDRLLGDIGEDTV